MIIFFVCSVDVNCLASVCAHKHFSATKIGRGKYYYYVYLFFFCFSFENERKKNRNRCGKIGSNVRCCCGCLVLFVLCLRATKLKPIAKLRTSKAWLFFSSLLQCSCCCSFFTNERYFCYLLLLPLLYIDVRLFHSKFYTITTHNIFLARAILLFSNRECAQTFQTKCVFCCARCVDVCVCFAFFT